MRGQIIGDILMKFKNKGRKIYKTKEKNYYGKTPVGKFLSGALTVLLIGGIGFLGYSVAEPIVNYTKKQGDNDIPSVSAENTTQSVSDTQATAATVNVPENVNVEQFNAVFLSKDDLTDITALRSALQRVSAGADTEYIAVPLKVSGGEIYYASEVSEAVMCGAVKSQLTLAEITSEIKSAGFKPAAELSVLRDNILPQAYPEMGYTTADDGSRWIDNDIENGGKPWISPFSESAVSYIEAVADEIAASDFSKVICSDMVFPPFRDSDLALLSDEVRSSERYLELTSLVNTLYSKMIKGGAAMMLEVSAADLLQGNGEVIQPMLLDVNTLVLNICFDELGDAVAAQGTVYEFTGTPAENASKAIGLVQHKLADYNVVVRISGSNINESGVSEIKEAAAEYGYTSFIIG